jgi:hypothetical protein
MKMRTSLACVLSLGALLAIPAVSSAQTFNGTIPDGRLNDPVVIAAAGSKCFYFFGIAGRSYSVEVQEIDAIGVYTSFFGAGGSVCPGVTDPMYNITSANDPPATFGVRASFTAPTTNYYMVTINNTSGSPDTFRYGVSDTTQFSPVWSTNGTFDTFYSFMNTSNASCAGNLVMRNTAGTIITNATFTVAANATLSTNTAALATTRNLTGTARLTHNCPPGAILSEAAVANFTISPTPYFQFVHFETTRTNQH